MSLENPWKISLYAPASLWYGDGGNYLGDVWAPKSITVTVRHNASSTAVINVALGDEIAQTLIADGTRAKIWRNGELLFTGCLDTVSVNGPWVKGQVSASFIGDFSVLHQLLTHPYGNGALPSPQDPGQYYKATGSAEDVAKDLIAANAGRWGASYLTQAAKHTPRLGSTISVSTRYEELYNALFPRFDQAGVGLTVIHDGNSLVYDVYEVTDYPKVLDEESGIVADWSFATASPTANLVVSGGTYTPSGGGGGQFIPKTASDPASQGTWGVRVSYRQADGGTSSSTLTDVENAAQSAANDGLEELAGKNGISVKLTQTGQFQYGAATGLVVGKRVTIALNGITRTDILREVQFTFDTSVGDQTIPVVGDIRDDPDKNIGAYLSQLKRGIKRLEVKT